MEDVLIICCSFAQPTKLVRQGLKCNREGRRGREESLPVASIPLNGLINANNIV